MVIAEIYKGTKNYVIIMKQHYWEKMLQRSKKQIRNLHTHITTSLLCNV